MSNQDFLKVPGSLGSTLNAESQVLKYALDIDLTQHFYTKKGEHKLDSGIHPSQKKLNRPMSVKSSFVRYKQTQL